MSPDYELLVQSIIDRLVDQVPGFDSVEDADNLSDAFSKGTTGDKAFVIDMGESAKGRLAQNSRAQIEQLDISVVVATTNFRSKSDGRSGNTTLRRLTKIALTGDRDWKPTGALRPLTFKRTRFFARTRGRVGYELRFETEAHNDYQP